MSRVPLFIESGAKSGRFFAAGAVLGIPTFSRAEKKKQSAKKG